MPLSLDLLWTAFERVQENAGCAGSDAVTVQHFSRRASTLLPQLLDRVSQNKYRPFPLLEIIVEKKPGSSETRRLLVPTVADRILQTAVARHLSHSFEEEFLECSFAYRPGRSVDRAIARIRKCHELGFRFVVDADIAAYFDQIDHRLLLSRLAARPLGGTIQTLLKLWIKAPIWNGSKILPLRAGIPQGSPISPLLANFFLEDFDRELEKSGRKLIRYSDDFVILAQTSEEARQSLLQTETLLAQSHLELNHGKTRIADFDHGFRFLGALFLGEGIWIPWGRERKAGRIVFMARPLPAAMRARFEMAPPKTSLEIALARVQLIQPPSQNTGRNEPVAYLYLTEQGSILRKAGDRLLVEKEDELLLDIPYHKLEAILLFGNVQVTTQAMAELLEKGVSLSLFSRQGQYRGALEPPRGKNIDLRIAQFSTFREAPAALAIAKSIVSAKIANGLATLDLYRRHSGPGNDFDSRRTSLAAALSSLETAPDIASLDGVEGAAAREYFQLLMLFNKSELAWPGRVKHPATDPLNALLSLTYTLIMNELCALLEGAGLDPYLGFLHQVDYGRPSLALDLLEPFRHPVADRLVLTLINKRMLEAPDFQSGGPGHGVFLDPKAMKRYFAEYERWMLNNPQHTLQPPFRPTALSEPRLPGSVPNTTALSEPRPPGSVNSIPHETSFRESLRAEVEKLCAALRNGVPFEPWRFRPKQPPLPSPEIVTPPANPETEGPCNSSSATT
jgi:CRISPR-associated protein Cas1